MEKKSFSVILRTTDKNSGYNNNPVYTVNFNSVIPPSSHKKYRLTSSFHTQSYDNFNDYVKSNIAYTKQQAEVYINLISPSNQYDTDTDGTSSILLLGTGQRRFTTSNTSIANSYYSFGFTDSVPCIVDGSISFTQYVSVHIINPYTQETGSTFNGKKYLLATNTSNNADVANTFADNTLILNFQEI